MTEMGDIIRSGERISLSHYGLDTAQWQAMLVSAGSTLPLLSCWADETRVYILLLERDRPLLASTPIEDRRYLAPSSRFAGADWGEKVAFDLWGVEAMNAQSDGYPALDEGAWEETWPLSTTPNVGGSQPFPSPAGERLKPEESGLSGPLELSYHLLRGKAQTLTMKAGLAHRGVLSRAVGQSPEKALSFISRMTAGGFVAHSLAFCRALAQAQGREISSDIRDAWMILLEIERISVHLFDLARTARSVDAGLLATHCDHAREGIARVCYELLGSRRLTDIVTCDGVREGVEIIPLAQAVIAVLEPRLSALLELQSVFASRLKGIAVLRPELATKFAIGGLVGRASGRHLDVRRREAGMRLEALRSTGSSQGDAAARDNLRVLEIRDSLTVLQRILGNFGTQDDEPVSRATDEGIGAAEGARGDIWYWLRLKDGKIRALQARDPSVSVLSVLPNVLGGMAPEQLSVALQSFALSPAGIAM
ncbi:NADH-quinone oxidoreductase subunit D-related protein [Swingsia samuiensis]|nr:hypothetical protein [Swingsia samuiensis]